MTNAVKFFKENIKQIASMMLVAVVVVTAFISYFRVNSYSVGYEEAILLSKLDIFTGYEDGIDDAEFRHFLMSKATIRTAMLSFKRMQGAYNINGVDGDILNEDDMILYYKYLDIDVIPDLLPENKKQQDTISSDDAYSMALKALGYDETDYSFLATEESNGMTEFLESLQFGFSLPIEEQSELTNGELACIIYETFYAIPNGAGIPVYRIRANINSDFRLLLLEYGLFDDIPTDYAPLFVKGIYKQNSFSALLGENSDGTLPKNEWAASYEYVLQNEVDDYIKLLETSGYVMDSQYNMEHTDEFDMTYKYIITLMYKEITFSYKQEQVSMTAYCVIKYDTDNDILEWNLLI